VIPGSIDFIRDVIELGHEVFICSTPTSTYDPNVIEKYRWVEKNLGKDFINRLILTRDKTLIRGDILIDDNLEIKGKLSPVWKHVVFNAPYNINIGEQFRIKEDWSNWKEILLK
jgi:5'-nucleotidase